MKEDRRRIVQDVTERERSEEDLRASSETYRAVFTSSDEGFCLCELLFDAHGKAVDYRFLETNPAFEHLTGLKEAAGRTARECVPALESVWVELFADVWRTRQAARVEAYSAALGRWFNVYATRVGGEAARVVACVFNDVSERKRAEEALRAAHEELEARVLERTRKLAAANESLRAEIAQRRRAEAGRRDLLRQLVNAQEGERQRISRELHDQLGQQVSTLTLKLGLLKKQPDLDANTRDELEKLEALARQTDSDLDFLVWELRPTALDDLGLIDALGDYAETWSRHFGIPVRLQAVGVHGARPNPEVETVLYRVAQEALNNVAKHARARCVQITLERAGTQVSLTVQDNGIGFDPEQPFGSGSKGLGLLGMRERAALLKGAVEIASKPGAGTTVRVRVPMRPEKREGRSAAPAFRRLEGYGD